MNTSRRSPLHVFFGATSMIEFTRRSREQQNPLKATITAEAAHPPSKMFDRTFSYLQTVRLPAAGNNCIKVHTRRTELVIIRSNDIEFYRREAITVRTKVTFRVCLQTIVRLRPLTWPCLRSWKLSTQM